MKTLYFLFALLLAFNVFAARTIKTTQPGMELEFLKTEAGSYSGSLTITASNCPTMSATTQVNITATTVFTFGDHELETGDKVRITTSVTVPLGADPDTDYYVYDLSDDTFNLATTKALAKAGTPDVTFTSTGLGNHTVCINEFKDTDHGFVEGERVQITTTGTLPTGMSLSTDYWIDYIDKDTFNIKSTYGIATPIEWTDTGTDNTATGTLTATRTDDFAGLSKFQVTVTATETGFYIVDRKTPYASADQIGAVVSPITEACEVRVVSQTASRTIVNTTASADGTTEMDCYFNLILFGSTFPDSY